MFKVSHNIDIRRELAMNPFCRIARVSDDDGVNLRTVTITFSPSIIISDEKTAREDADRHKVECVRIIVASEWNRKISSKFVGYGLFDKEEDALLGTKDFRWV